MAVNVVRSKEWQDAEMLEVESDARDNYAAILEIEDWAYEHGYLRPNESWLPQLINEAGVPVRASILYRPRVVQVRARHRGIEAIGAATAS